MIKVGGSLITDRRQYRTARHRAIDHFARVIVAWRARRRSDVLIILGGGAFGHNVVHRHGLDSGGAHRCSGEVFELTAALYELKVLFARAMQRHGGAAIPLQESGLFASQNGTPELINPGPIEACLAGGYVPLLTGGLMVAPGGGFHAIGSDRMALPIADAFALRRVAVITDRPGVMRGDRVIRRVTAARFDRVLAEISAPTKLDVTGGMRAKFAAAVELARRGVETVIAGGPAIDPAWLDSLFTRRPPGTLVAAAPDQPASST
ncbi:MAG TPA: hypothetical protein VGD37_19870 [Kofleriaceae bacterium]